jgi:hypothetical protein
MSAMSVFSIIDWRDIGIYERSAPRNPAEGPVPDPRLRSARTITRNGWDNMFRKCSDSAPLQAPTSSQLRAIWGQRCRSFYLLHADLSDNVGNLDSCLPTCHLTLALLDRNLNAPEAYISDAWSNATDLRPTTLSPQCHYLYLLENGNTVIKYFSGTREKSLLICKVSTIPICSERQKINAATT